MKKLSISQTRNLLEVMETLEDCLGGESTSWLGRLFFLASDEQKKMVQESLNDHKAFYELPLEERLVKSGFLKNKDGNLEKTIEL